MKKTAARWGVGVVAGLAALATAAPAWACGGLVAPNGTVRLVRTSTLAAYHNGLEHYVTSFSFGGEGKEVGSIVPLPGIPSKVERGGDWTLQRLDREFSPRFEGAGLAAASSKSDSSDAVEVYKTKIDALDIVILKGGGAEVGRWAAKHGYLLTPDSPAVLDFYARRSPIFMAARFDAEAARAKGQGAGDGTPIHLTIPTKNPWVPLRILTLGREDREPIDAEVYLMTDREPSLLPLRADTVTQQFSGAASEQLMTDLRTDKGMEWMPTHAWVMAFRVNGESQRLHYDLAVDASGRGRPSLVDAGLVRPRAAVATTSTAKPTTTTAAPTTTTRRDLALPVQRTSHSSPVLGLAALMVLLAAAGVGVLRYRRLGRP
jgi:hypothetical protein